MMLRKTFLRMAAGAMAAGMLGDYLGQRRPALPEPSLAGSEQPQSLLAALMRMKGSYGVHHGGVATHFTCSLGTMRELVEEIEAGAYFNVGTQAVEDGMQTLIVHDMRWVPDREGMRPHELVVGQLCPDCSGQGWVPRVRMPDTSPLPGLPMPARAMVESHPCGMCKDTPGWQKRHWGSRTPRLA